MEVVGTWPFSHNASFCQIRVTRGLSVQVGLEGSWLRPVPIHMPPPKLPCTIWLSAWLMSAAAFVALAAPYFR